MRLLRYALRLVLAFSIAALALTSSAALSTPMAPAATPPVAMGSTDSPNVSLPISFALHLLPYTGFGVNLSFPARVNLTGGALDVGTNLSGTVSFAVA
ncbi:MAG: hypothetical protein L3K09_06080, partial [Thermoplasmata archaeon]|nr:hypothetical protein [Thermoplasmata archaeon]